jgi:hypothetical protein
MDRDEYPPAGSLGPPHPSGKAAKRLRSHIAANEVIIFEEAMADKEYPYITCSIWGVIPTNELFVRLTNGDISFVASTYSPVEVPLMASRVRGMNAADADAAGALADRIWAQHRNELIKAGSRTGRGETR